MKLKKYLLALLMLSSIQITFGQSETTNYLQNYSEENAVQTVYTHQNTDRVLIWSEDFVNGLASTNGTWTQAGTDQIWKQSFYTTSGEWSVGTPEFASTTNANGFMLFDADSVNFIVTPNYLDRSGSLISPSIDLSGEPAVILEFEHNFRYCCGTIELLASVSNDGGVTWTDYPVDDGVAVNTGSANPQINAIDISAVAGGQANVQLKFSFGGLTNSHYYWAIDDINLSSVALPVSATVSGVDADCNGNCTGTATAVGGNGLAPYTYLWNDPSTQTTDVATGLCAGSYSCIITDDNGDTISVAITIVEPSALTSTSTATGSNGSDGTATTSASGGTAPYTYLWNDPSFQTTATATGLAPGNYSVVIIDANGCLFDDNVTVSDFSEIENHSNLFGQVEISPNPSSDKFTITFSQKIEGNTTIQIVNVAGEVIETIELNNVHDGKVIVINAENWSKGIYLLQLTNDKVISQGIKLIKD